MDEWHLIFHLLKKAEEDIISILMQINVPLLALVDYKLKLAGLLPQTKTFTYC